MTTATQYETRRTAGLAYESQGSGTPVVFLHGLTFNRTTWRPISTRLGGTVHTIALDLPAHGQSAGPPLPLDQLAERVHALLSALGVREPLLVGHSLSASLALLYAGDYPTLGVVDVDQSLDIRPFAALLHRLEPVLRGPGFASAFEQFQQSMALDRIPEPLRKLVHDSQHVNQEVVLGYWDDVLRSDANELQARIDQGLATLELPCLAILGRPSADGPGHGLSLLRNLELEHWPDHGHLPHLVDPDRFTTRLRTFIDRCTT
jgi:pimeloyl-ACP methyl ester carboxylesterase